MYHRNCLRNYERKLKGNPNTKQRSNLNIGKHISDIDILNAVRCSLSEGCTMTMNDIHELHVFILVDNDVDPGESPHQWTAQEVVND